MAPYPHRVPGSARRGACLAAAAVALAGGGVAGCGVIGAVSKVAHTVSTNRSIINGFTTKLSNSAKTFEATYVTTGSSPATVVYAVQPPRNLLFSETQGGTAGSGGAGSFKIVSNSSGEYLCSVSPGSARGAGQWGCQKLGPARAKVENQVLDFYTPVHWVNFLKGFALAAGFAGDKVTTSTKSINGISMSCVDFRAPGINGTSSICTAPQNILGYVKVAGDPNSFELKSYSTSPAGSLFQPPPGAKITSANG
jgi:hypothetical protein